MPVRPKIPNRPRIPARLRADLDPGANRLQSDLVDADDQRRAADASMALITDHYKFIDGQQRREIAMLDGRTNWRTTTTTLLLGAFSLSIQRIASANVDISGLAITTAIVAIIYALALVVGVVSTLNVGRGHADDLALDAKRAWDRLITMAPEDVRYDITKSLATACVNTEHLLRWKRTWNRRATIAMMVQAACVMAIVVVQVSLGV